MKFIFIYLHLVFIVFLNFSCNSTNPVYQATKEDPADPSLLPDLKRVYMDGGLEKDLAVVSINQGNANKDLLRIQVNLKNLTKKSMNLIYKIEWMNEDGIVFNDSSSVWMPLSLRGAEIVAVQSIASSPLAKNFWLKVQRAKK